MTPLQRLIEDVRDRERGLSYAKLAKRSEKPDGSGGITRGRIQQLATQPVRRGLDTETREALARALRVPLSVINDALSSSVGTFNERGEDIETRRLLAFVRNLPADQQDRWYRLARALADALATEDEREVTAQSENSGDDAISTQNVAIDRSIGSHDEQIVAAGPEGALPPTAAEQEYLDTLSDAALERMRRRHTGE